MATTRALSIGTALLGAVLSLYGTIDYNPDRIRQSGYVIALLGASIGLYGLSTLGWFMPKKRH